MPKEGKIKDRGNVPYENGEIRMGVQESLARREIARKAEIDRTERVRKATLEPMAAAEESMGRHREILPSQDYNFIIAILAHSSVVLNREKIKNLRTIRDDATIRTLLLAPPDTGCFVDDDADVRKQLDSMFQRSPEDLRNGNEGLFGSEPADVLENFLLSMKPSTEERDEWLAGYETAFGGVYRVEAQRFLDSGGQISKRPFFYHNREWVFDSDEDADGHDDGSGGFVLLIERSPETGVTLTHLYEAEIVSGVERGTPFRLTKEQLLIDVFDKMDREGKFLHKPLVLDLGCCNSVQGDTSLKDYIDYGVYGGKTRIKSKKRKTRKKKKSYRSKKR